MDVHPLSMQLVLGWRMFQTVTGYAHHVVVKPVDYLLPRILASMLKIIYLSAASNVNVNITLAACRIY